MIQVLRNPMPEEYFVELRRLTIELLSKRVDEKISKWEEENNIDAEYYENLSKQHFRSNKNKFE